MLSSSDIEQLIQKLPADATVDQVMTMLAKEDPLTFCIYNRRLRQRALVFDNIREVTDEALDMMRKTWTANGRSQKEIEREVTGRYLAHRPFLIKPLCDDHEHKVYQKARQTGVSELSITEVAHFLYKHARKKWVYTFPRDMQLKDFSTTRITPMFDETPRMKAVLARPQATYVREIGDGSWMLLRSAWEGGLGEGIDADGVTFDEKDRMKEGVEVAFKESMKSSAFGLLREVSTPSIPGRGVNASFSQSDQQVWLVRCTKCNYEQEVQYPDNIVETMDIPTGTTELPPNSYRFACAKFKCRGPLDRLRGRWVARFPDRKLIRGYLLPQTIAAWISATELMQNRITYKSEQFFSNYCLGMPSMGDSILVTDEDFEKSTAGHQLLTSRNHRDWSQVSVGIDWGHMNWVVITALNNHNQQRYIIGIKAVEDTPRPLESAKIIGDYIAPFQPDIIIPDFGYGKDRNAYLLKRFGVGRLYACIYNPASRASRAFQPTWSAPESARVTVDRTMTIKRTCQLFQERELGLPSMDSDLAKLLVKHFKALAPMKIEEDGETYEEIASKGDDHLAHATCYSFLGLDRLTAGGHFNFAWI